MLRSVKDLGGFKIHASDGDIGKVKEFYFDDETWAIRYLVVDLGSWLPGRRVLLSPVALDHPDPASHTLLVKLTKSQVENSPDMDTERPLSRQKEVELYEYFGWPNYWGGDPMLGAGVLGVSPRVLATIGEPEETGAPVEEPKGDPHLRSTSEVIGYHIQASDGEIGHADDFILDDEGWVIRYMVVDTRNWLPGKKVLVAPQWILKASWAESKVYVDLPRDMIQSSPEFDYAAPITRNYELKLYEYYNRPKYWSAP